MLIRKRLVPQLAPLLLLGLLCVVGVQAATVQVTGADGLTGANGDSGNPGQPGGAGGPGANATAVAATVGDPSNTAIATGGFGGQGGAGGDGENPDDPYATANGGNGGDGGHGGDASATASTVVTVGDASATARAAGNYGGIGGPGGGYSGTGVYGAYGSRGQSGNATAAATATAPGKVTIRVDAWGAPGADVFPGDAGIAGGGASLGTVFGTSTAGGDVDIIANVTGGSGSGPGAPGASVHLDNAIDGSTSGYLSLYQIAEAGGTEADDAPAGNASNTLIKTGSLTTLQLTTDTVGGSGYFSGNAISNVVADNDSGSSFADSRASGGSARTSLSGGKGGDGIATASALSAGTGEAIGFANAYGGGHYTTGTIPIGTGGNATSTVDATSRGSGYAYADSIAIGGDGSVAGGNASATATVTAGNGGAVTNVFVQGGIGTGDSPDGSATAHSSATVRGVYASASPITRAEGGTGSSTAEINIADGPLTAGLVTVSAPIAGDGTTRVRAYTEVDAGMAQSWTGPALLPSTFLNFQSAARADILPSAAYIASAVLGNATVAAAIDPSSPGLLHAILGGGYAPDGVGIATTYSSSIALSFDPEQLAGGDTLLLGLLDPVASGNGFDELRFRVVIEDVTVFDQTFSDAASALALFDDHVLDLGNWRTDLQGDLDLRFLLDLTASRPGDAFYTSFVATTVPLPSGVWLLGTAVAALVRYRRR